MELVQEELVRQELLEELLEESLEVEVKHSRLRSK